MLHDDTHMPEKCSARFRMTGCLNLFKNVLTHIHLAQALAPVLTKTSSLKWLSLSAKVGSLDDNALGGWYSYRMSKTALNMFIKNLSIEWGVNRLKFMWRAYTREPRILSCPNLFIKIFHQIDCTVQSRLLRV